MYSAWRWLWAWAHFFFSTLTTWQHSCTYKWFHFDPWGETVPRCLPHLLTQAWCLYCIVLLNLVCLHNHLNISPKKSTRWRQGNTWIIILLLILLYYLFSWFFFVAIMGFYFTFLCLQYTNQNHDFMLKTNIGFRAEVFLANWSLDYCFHAEPLETDVTRNHCNNYLLLKKRCWCGCPFKFIPSFPNIH